ncbi:ADP-ribosylation factor-like protein 6-interacting protein 4 [Dromiciops gliroides]|uniref:ADP-ribosylation factor-like protein 6-interacting protein 4 n=1 Tax=Dromiciops gliroides TaxID=33562 RepID=UPI001CC81C8A|nr:ADP-ribosylation factor-like protein 6-interacting protein 4 [Dromiciops gliroides]
MRNWTGLTQKLQVSSSSPLKQPSPTINPSQDPHPSKPEKGEKGLDGGTGDTPTWGQDANPSGQKHACTEQLPAEVGPITSKGHGDRQDGWEASRSGHAEEGQQHRRCEVLPQSRILPRLRPPWTLEASQGRGGGVWKGARRPAAQGPGGGGAHGQRAAREHPTPCRTRPRPRPRRCPSPASQLRPSKGLVLTSGFGGRGGPTEPPARSVRIRPPRKSPNGGLMRASGKGTEQRPRWRRQRRLRRRRAAAAGAANIRGRAPGTTSLLLPPPPSPSSRYPHPAGGGGDVAAPPSWRQRHLFPRSGPLGASRERAIQDPSAGRNSAPGP